MFIKEISSTKTTNLGKKIVRNTTYGQYKGYSIAVDNYVQDGKITGKQFVIWNDTMQKIVNKFRNKNKKGFHRIG